MTLTMRLVVFILGLTLWCDAALAANELSPEAQKHFKAGVAYVDDPNGSKWEDALKEFRAAYAASPSWKIMNNIGLCALNLERDGEAIEAFREYLNHGGETDFTPKQRKQMETDIATLSASLVRLDIEVEPTDAILVDERKNSKGELLVNQYPVRNGRASLGLHPGLHRVTVQAPGFITAEWSLNADPSSTHVHQFKLERVKSNASAANAPSPGSNDSSTRERDATTAAYVGLAATGVFAIATTVTGLMALSQKNKFNDAKDRADRSSAQDASDKGKRLALFSDISLGAAVVSAGITTYLFLAAPSRAAEKRGTSLPGKPTGQVEAKHGAWTSAQLIPVIGRDNLGVGLEAKF